MGSLPQDNVIRVFAEDPSDALCNRYAFIKLSKYLSWPDDFWYQGQFGKIKKQRRKSLFVEAPKNPGYYYIATGIIPKIIEICKEKGFDYKIKNKGFTVPSTDPECPGVLFRPNQLKAIQAATKEGRGIIQAATAAGKCLGFDVPVLMFNGKIKKVQDVVPGDLLMGPDSKPRKVESVTSGKEEMFRIIPKDGSDSYSVNKSHILSLVMSGKRKVSGIETGVPFNIEMSDYLEKGSHFKHCAKAWRSSVEWKKKKLPIDPYFLGLWLGDGSNVHLNTIYTPDSEIKEFILNFAKGWGMKVAVSQNSGCEKLAITNHNRTLEKNPILEILRSLGIQNNKRIPYDFKTSSRNDRLRLLAGLVDTDGHKSKHGYEIISKYKRLAHDIVFVARSLGLSARVSSSYKKSQTMEEKKEYFRVFIGGDAFIIPCKVERKKLYQHKKQKDARKYGFDVEPLGVGNYYGFEISGPDRLFLLGDFTVTHNTIISYGIFQAYLQANEGSKVLFLAHTVDLVRQAAKQFKKLGANVGIWQGSTKENGDIICSTIQTLENMGTDYYLDKFICLIVDEVHHVSSFGGRYFKILQDSFCPARFGMTATLPNKEESRLAAEAAIGPVIDTFSISDGVKAGILSKPKIYFLPYKGSHFMGEMKTYKDIYKKNIVENVSRNKLISRMAIKFAEKGQSSLIFVRQIDHGDRISKLLNAGGIKHCWVHGLSAKDEREAVQEALEKKKVKIAICSTIWNEGISINSLNNCINAGGGKDEKMVLQIVGRGTRVDDGKTTVNIWDFLDPQKHLAQHCIERMIVYREQGWDVSILKKKEK